MADVINPCAPSLRLLILVLAIAVPDLRYGYKLSHANPETHNGCGRSVRQWRWDMELRRWVLRGALAGFVVLGVGGRLLMRVVAHREHRPVLLFTIPGTLTVLLAGTVSGLAAGLIYYLLRRFVRAEWLRTAAFLIICGLISWRGVHGLLLVPQLMFMALALLFLIIIDAMGRQVPLMRGQSSHLT